MLNSSPLLDLVRAGAFVMLFFSAILILVVVRRIEAPIKFGTRVGPLLVGIALVLFALPIYGDVGRAQTLVRPASALRIVAGLALPLGLFLMKPLGRQHFVGRVEEEDEEEPDGEADGEEAADHSEAEPADDA